MWNIAKEFSFCYGHRVHNQTLNEEYSLDSACVCRHLHGHQGTIMIYLEGGELKNGMITDFKHLNWFKKWLDDTLDHKFIMDINDPLLKYEVPLLFEDNRRTPDFFKLNVDREKDFYKINPSEYYRLEQYLQEKYEGMVFVNFVPTSENLSKWIFEIVSNSMKRIGVKVCRVQFFETPKSQAIYYA